MPRPPHFTPSELPGRRFGRLVVLSEAEMYVRPDHKGSERQWLCRCDCGAETVVRQGKMVSNRVQSCGCLQREAAVLSRTTHGHTHHSGNWSTEYRIWLSMRTRCENPKAVSYPHYGGRGITVCERWGSFENFYADMGDRPSVGHTLDRIDNDGPYAPENCRWATRAQQARNTRRGLFVTHQGRTMPVCDWAEEFGIHPGTLRDRLKRGLSFEQAVSLQSTLG